MKPQIDVTDFAKLDLRVGEIVDTSEVEGSEKLVELQVDFGPAFAESYGEARRTIYAGIKKWYTAESLVGRKLIFVVNLAPKKFKIGNREYISEGMLMAAGADEAVLYNFDQALEPGTIIR